MVIENVVAWGTSYKEGADKIIVFTRFKDEEITNLNEIKNLTTRSKEFILSIGRENDVDFNVITQEGVKCFAIEFKTIKSKQSSDKIEDVMEEFENMIKKGYNPFYNGLINAMR